MIKDAEIIGVWGARGSGKTTRLIELLKKRDRVIVLDPINGFKAKGYKTVKSFNSLYKEIKKGWNSGFKIILKTSSREHDCLAVMAELRKSLWLIQKPYSQEKDKRKITLCIDEAHKFIPNYHLPQAQKEPIEDIISLGRHYGIEIFGASQRIAKVWTEFRDNCSQHYFLMPGSSNNIKAMLSEIGNEHKKDLMSLKPHQFLHKGEGLKITKGKNPPKRR